MSGNLWNAFQQQDGFYYYLANKDVSNTVLIFFDILVKNKYTYKFFK